MLLVPHPVSLYLVCAPILTFYPHSQLAANGSQLSPSKFHPDPTGSNEYESYHAPNLAAGSSLPVSHGERLWGKARWPGTIL